jgi:hypothetical protein
VSRAAVVLRRVLHTNVCFESDLLGHGVLLLPLPDIRAAGTKWMPVRLPLCHGGGTLAVKFSLAPGTQGQPLEAAVKAALASGVGNNTGAIQGESEGVLWLEREVGG